jgi:hypothetical protein
MSRLLRRSFLVELVYLSAAGASLCYSSAHAQSGAQRDWRYCGKCQGMFFDGYPQKGACPAGGGHQAIGLNFILPHDVGETQTAQRNWRYCGKCQGMFFDGYPQKGACPAGGGHQAIGFNFVLPHDIAATNKSQTSWRFCAKCSTMFYDGYPNKGTCPVGGGHQSAGYVFVLPHEGEPFANALEAFWRDAGRGIVAEAIKQSVNGKQFANGVSGYNCNVNLSDMTASWRRKGPMSLTVEMRVPNNNAEFKTTTPTVFGSYADPSFRVGFSMFVRLTLRAQAGAPSVNVDIINAEISNASVRGSNASGTLVETLGDFFTGGSFSRRITSQINDDQRIKAQVQNAINTSLSRIPNINVP